MRYLYTPSNYYHTYGSVQESRGPLRRIQGRRKNWGTAIEQIDELILDDLEFKTLDDTERKYLEEFANLIILSANNCGITTLKNFPKLDTLEKIELTENKIPAVDLTILPQYPQLRKLLLGNNKDIKSIEDIKPFARLKELYWLDLTGCNITSVKDYRAEVFKMLPRLEVLDRADKEGKEILSDEDDEEVSPSVDDESYSEEHEEAGPSKEGKRKVYDEEDSESDDSEEVKPKKDQPKQANKKKKKESSESDD